MLSAREKANPYQSACRAGAALPIPWEELFGVSWAAHAALRSLRTGLPMTIEEDSEDET